MKIFNILILILAITVGDCFFDKENGRYLKENQANNDSFQILLKLSLILANKSIMNLIFLSALKYKNKEKICCQKLSKYNFCCF
jgi:hypothetical protein